MNPNNVQTPGSTLNPNLMSNLPPPSTTNIQNTLPTDSQQILPMDIDSVVQETSFAFPQQQRQIYGEDYVDMGEVPLTKVGNNDGSRRRIQKKAIFVGKQPSLLQKVKDKGGIQCDQIKNSMEESNLKETFLNNQPCCKSLFDRVLEIYQGYENKFMNEFVNKIINPYMPENFERFNTDKMFTYKDLETVLSNTVPSNSTLSKSSLDELKSEFCKSIKGSNDVLKNELLSSLIDNIEQKLSENMHRAFSKYVSKLMNDPGISLDDKKNLYNDFKQLMIQNDKTSIFHSVNTEDLELAKNADQVCGQIGEEDEPDYDEASVSEIIEYLKSKQTIPTIAQDFVAHDYSPTSTLTGKLLWMATGTGKTCTTLSLLDQFMDAGYTIFWILPPKSQRYPKPTTRVGNSTMRAQLYRDMIVRLCNKALLDQLSDMTDTIQSNDTLVGLLIELAQSQTSMTDKEVFSLTNKLFKNLNLKNLWLGNSDRQFKYRFHNDRTQGSFNNIDDNTFIIEFDELYTLFVNPHKLSKLSYQTTKHLAQYLSTINYHKCVIVIDEIHNLVNPMRGTGNSFGYIENDQVREQIINNMMYYMSQNGSESLKVIGLSATPDSDPSLNGFATLLNLFNVQTPNYTRWTGSDLRSALRLSTNDANLSYSNDNINNLALTTLQTIDYIDFSNPSYHGNAIPNNIVYHLIDSEVVLAQKKAVINSLFSEGSNLRFRRSRKRGGKVIKKMDQELRESLLKIGVGINQLAESRLLYKLDIFNKNLGLQYDEDTQKLRRVVRVYATKVLSMLKIMNVEEDPTKNHLIYVETDEEALEVAAMLQAFGIPMITMKYDKGSNEFSYTSGHIQRVYGGKSTFGIYGLEYNSVQKHLIEEKQGKRGAPIKNAQPLGYPWIKVKSINGGKITDSKEWDAYQSAILNTYNLFDPNINLLNILIINKNNLVGKSFYNTTSMHLLDIPDNISDFKQLVGRILRMCGTVNQQSDTGYSSTDYTYDMSNVTVDIYMYRSIIFEAGQKYLSIRDLIKGVSSQENKIKDKLTEFIQQNNSAQIIQSLVLP